MARDQDDERQDYGFSDEFESEQESDWFFDLPAGAWERQEEKNQDLRRRLLEQTGHHKEPEPAPTDIAEDGPDDAEEAADTPGAEPRKRRWGLGKKLEHAAVEPDPSIESDNIAASPWGIEAEELEFVPPPHFDAENEPDESRGPSTAPVELTDLDDHRDVADAEIQSDETITAPLSKWDEALASSQGSGSIIDGMREWVGRNKAAAEAESSDSSFQDAGFTAGVVPVGHAAAADETNEADDEQDDEWVVELLEADREVPEPLIEKRGFFAKMLGRGKKDSFDEDETLEAAKAAPDWAPEEPPHEPAAISDMDEPMSEKDPWAEFLRDADFATDVPDTPSAATGEPETVLANEEESAASSEIGRGDRPAADHVPDIEQEDEVPVVGPPPSFVEDAGDDALGPAPLFESEAPGNIFGAEDQDKSPGEEASWDDVVDSGQDASASDTEEDAAAETSAAIDEPVASDDVEVEADVFAAAFPAASSTDESWDDIADLGGAQPSFEAENDPGTDTGESPLSFPALTEETVDVATHDVDPVEEAAAMGFEAPAELDESHDDKAWDEAVTFGPDTASDATIADAGEREFSLADALSGSPHDDPPTEETQFAEPSETTEFSFDHDPATALVQVDEPVAEDSWGDTVATDDANEEAKPGDDPDPTPGDAEEAPARDPWDVIAALGEELERDGGSPEPGVILGRTGAVSRSSALEETSASQLNIDDIVGLPAEGEDDPGAEEVHEDSGWQLANTVNAEASDDDDVVLRAFNAHAAAADDPDDDTDDSEMKQREPASFDDLLDDESESIVFMPMDASSDDGRPIGQPAWAPQRSVDVFDGEQVSEYADEEPASFRHSFPESDDDDGGIRPPWEVDDDGRSGGSSGSGSARTKTLVRELVETGLLALLVFLAVRASFQNFKVEGESMFPTLEDGQYIIVNKLAYAEVDMDKLNDFVPFVSAEEGEEQYVFQGPERGTIIVFKSPRNPSEDLIKRIIGLPGETIEIVDGQVYVNGFRLDEPYVNGPWTDEYPRILVGPDEYFVMGDNRQNSQDSRNRGVGLIHKDLIIGKAMVSYWPRSQMGLAPNGGAQLTDERVPISTAKVSD
jgi:signal peptidase I